MNFIKEKKLMLQRLKIKLDMQQFYLQFLISESIVFLIELQHFIKKNFIKLVANIFKILIK